MTNARTQSFRLGQRDEREVRWALGLDLKGDVGFKSGFGAFLNEMLMRSCLSTWTEKTPPRKHGGYHVDLRHHAGQCLSVAGHDQRTQLTYEMSDEVAFAGSKYSHVWRAILELSEEQWFALNIRYGQRRAHDQETTEDAANSVVNSGVVVGLEAFHDLGTLAGFTPTAQEALRSGVIGGLRSLSHSMTNPLDVDPIKADADFELFETIYGEADVLLSGACRAYVAASKQALRADTVAKLMRSKR